MAQKNIYNEIPGDKDSEERKLISADDSIQSNNLGENLTTDSAIVPRAYNASKTNIDKKGKKKKREEVFNNLEGDLEITPTPKNFRIIPGMTVRIVGIGKFLSGFYFVMNRSTNISNGNAMSIRLTVVKTDFNKDLKGNDIIPIETIDLMPEKEAKKKGGKQKGGAIDNLDKYPVETNTNNNPQPQTQKQTVIVQT